MHNDALERYLQEVVNKHDDIDQIDLITLWNRICYIKVKDIDGYKWRVFASTPHNACLKLNTLLRIIV